MKILVYSDENNKRRLFTECGTELTPSKLSVDVSMGEINSVYMDGSAGIGKPKRRITMVFDDVDVEFIKTPPEAKP